MSLDRYAASHANPQGPGDARPTALQIIQDLSLTSQWSERVLLITGVSSGLGVETARALATTGATLFLLARDLAKARTALGAALASSPRVHLVACDLSDLASVRSAAAHVAQSTARLDGIVANAGVMATPEGRTVQRIETQLGTNVVAHHVLVQLLVPRLLAAPAPRVVTLSSSGHRIAPVDLENPNLEGTYDPWKAYGQSKTGDVWLAALLDRRYAAQGLHAFSVHPGGIFTGLQKHVDEQTKRSWEEQGMGAKQFKSVEQGAATSVWALAEPKLVDEGHGGEYLEDLGLSPPHDGGKDILGVGYAEWAYDKQAQEKFWQWLEEVAKEWLVPL